MRIFKVGLTNQDFKWFSNLEEAINYAQYLSIETYKTVHIDFIDTPLYHTPSSLLQLLNGIGYSEVAAYSRGACLFDNKADLQKEK